MHIYTYLQILAMELVWIQTHMSGCEEFGIRHAWKRDEHHVNTLIAKYLVGGFIVYQLVCLLNLHKRTM